MDLYGVSLRKGETPDEISRKGIVQINAEHWKMLDLEWRMHNQSDVNHFAIQ